MSYLLIGLAGTELAPQERAWLARDEVGGVIIFTRNFASPSQLAALLGEVRAVDPDAISCVDQEGGRVQRIREPATALPPLGRIGARWSRDGDEALELALIHAQLMASEMLALGIDLSLAPVLDLARGCAVIGDRSFHADPQVVKQLGRAYVKGMHAAGMAACGKHFPGHGSVAEDTHHDVAVDPRPLATIAGCDMVPFTVAGRQGLDALMMSHVCYPAVDPGPAGYARSWIQDVVRDRMGFDGVVISDDLGMAAACGVGGFEARVGEAMAAGSDFLLVCRPEDVAACFAEVRRWPTPVGDRREALRRRRHLTWDGFAACPERAVWRERMAEI